jgi:hypothetical protein
MEKEKEKEKEKNERRRRRRRVKTTKHKSAWLKAREPKRRQVR